MSHRLPCALACALLAPTVLLAAEPPEKSPHKDVREPPFGEYDWSWMNGLNNQPPSLLAMGPLTWAIYLDAYYAYQFHQPIDHTIFPTTVAPRHDEISLNLATLGVEITGLDGPIGRLYIQYGSNVETTTGQDRTTQRGFFLTNRTFNYVQQAAGGWHFHALHGINAEIGIFPSYIGLESYLPQENWAYTHAFMSDATPYYFFGLRVQIYPTRRMKLELWVVNGWQTFGQWHEWRGGGYLWNWRPREWLSIVNSFYAGQEVQNDPGSVRLYVDNNVQLRWFKGETPRAPRFIASSLVVDYGYETRTNALSGSIFGATLTNRFQWTPIWGATLRGDIFWDQTRAISPVFPFGSPYVLPGTNPFLAGGVSVNVDCQPSPWALFRLEYSHREANQPLFSGPNGITGPGGVPAADPNTFTPDLRTRDDRLILNATIRL
jgi:Putative beta-barrel porin-2, OmpL-like. bbp2